MLTASGKSTTWLLVLQNVNTFSCHGGQNS